jgi:hypothetical protein
MAVLEFMVAGEFTALGFTGGGGFPGGGFHGRLGGFHGGVAGFPHGGFPHGGFHDGEFHAHGFHGERFHHHGFHGGAVLAPTFGGLWLGTGAGLALLLLSKRKLLRLRTVYPVLVLRQPSGVLPLRTAMQHQLADGPHQLM